MDPDFWASRWREGRIGFHEGRPNALLEKHLSRLGAGRRVLVPLCGKAEDLAFLASRGHRVVGVELVEDAVRAFFAERGLTPTVTPRGPFVEYAVGDVALFAGDFFAATPELLGPLDALYDRAALIALPPAMRGPYVAHLLSLLPAGTPGLVITLEYPQEKMQGPPFSVPEAELLAHYAGRAVEHLEDVAAEGPRAQELAGAMRERCWALRV